MGTLRDSVEEDAQGLPDATSITEALDAQVHSICEKSEQFSLCVC